MSPIIIYLQYYSILYRAIFGQLQEDIVRCSVLGHTSFTMISHSQSYGMLLVEHSLYGLAYGLPQLIWSMPLAGYCWIFVLWSPKVGLEYAVNWIFVLQFPTASLRYVTCKLNVVGDLEMMTMQILYEWFCRINNNVNIIYSNLPQSFKGTSISLYKGHQFMKGKGIHHIPAIAILFEPLYSNYLF